MRDDSVVPTAVVATTFVCTTNFVIHMVAVREGARFLFRAQRQLVDFTTLDVALISAGTMAVGTLAFRLLEELTPKFAWRAWRTLLLSAFFVSLYIGMSQFDESAAGWVALMHLSPFLALWVVAGAFRREFPPTA